MSKSLSQLTGGFYSYRLAIFTISLAFLTSCGGKSKKEETSQQVLRLPPTVTPKVEPIVAAVTPPTFRNGSLALGLVDRNACYSEHDGDKLGIELCKLRSDLVSIHLNPAHDFGLQGLAARVDARVAEMFDRAGAGYIACLDENYQGGIFYGTEDGDIEAPAYQSVEMDGVHEFEDGTSFDLEFPHVVSCYERHGGEDGPLTVMIGRKDGTYFSRLSSILGGGELTSIDGRDNMQLWMTMGDRIDTPPDGKEILDTNDPNVTYSGSTGLTNFRAYPDRQIMEVSTIGNQDCGYRLIANDEAVLLQANFNFIGTCHPTDTHVDTDGHPETYDADIADVVVCYDLRENEMTLLDDLELCEENGLTLDTFTVRHLRRQEFKAYNAGSMIGGLENPGINPFLVIEPSSLSGVEDLLGSEENVARILITADDDDATTASLSANCQQAATAEQSFEISYQYPFSRIYQDLQPPPDALNSEDFPSEEDFYRMMNEGIAAAPEQFKLLVGGGRTLGTSYRGKFTAEVSASLDGTEVGSLEISTPSENSNTLTEGVITISADGINASSTLTVTYTGLLQLECDNSVNLERRARFVSSIPRLQIPLKPIN